MESPEQNEPIPNFFLRTTQIVSRAAEAEQTLARRHFSSSGAMVSSVREYVDFGEKTRTSPHSSALCCLQK